MSIYEKLLATDLLPPIINMLQGGEMWLSKDDWKIHYKIRAMKASPWFMTNLCFQRDCSRGMLYFNFYGIICKECRLCWKVCCKMTTLRQLMKMKDLQLEMGLPSKCGFETVEDRWASRKGGLYSGFWYVPLMETKNLSLKEALKLKDLITEKLEEIFGKAVVPKVKRGCTEMERSFGDSKKWEELAKQNDWEGKEKILDRIFFHEGKTYMTEEMQAWERTFIGTHKIHQWINFAARNNDQTYLDFKDAPFASDLRVYTKEDLYGGIELIGGC